MNHLSTDFIYFRKRASERVLISILDTLASRPTAHTHAATVALVVIREWQIAESVYGEIDVPKYRHRLIWPSTMTIAPRSPDTILNLYKKVRISLAESPMVWCLFYEVISRIVQKGNCPLVQINKFVKFGQEEVLSIVMDILKPTIAARQTCSS